MVMIVVAIKIFLLTRLLRGATVREQPTAYDVDNFYSHASCEARHL